jgi:hypothetical protein
MSREARSHDPEDLQDRSPHRPVRPHQAAPSNTRDSRKQVDNADVNRESSDVRQEQLNRDAPSDSPRAYYLRDRAYLLYDSEIRSLSEIGKFRVIRVSDLAKYAYAESRKRTDKDIRRLVQQSLVTDRTIEISEKKALRIVTLTKAGYRLLKNTNRLPDGQPIYYGLVKPREVKHDADLYCLFQKEASRIVSSGGKPVRVLLDYELKRNLNRDLALLGPEKDKPDRKLEVAEKHRLQVVNGKIPVPDLRVEYETSELELRHVDLELATRDYRPRAMAEKAAAGFSLYGRSEDTTRLRRVLDQRKITAGILSL